MENILHKYKQDTAYADSFVILEQELAIALNHAHENIWIIKQSLFNRLVKIEPNLNTNKHIFTYAESILEILSPEHALSSLIPRELVNVIKSEIEHEKKHGLEEFNENIFGLCQMSIERKVRGDDYILGLSTYNRNLKRMGFFDYPKTHEHLTSKNIYKSFNQLINEYLTISHFSEEPLNLLVENHVAEQFRSNLSKVFRGSMSLLSRSRHSHSQELLGTEFNLANLYAVYFNIANMSNKELTQFLTGYYTDIPYFGKKTPPKIAITVYAPDKDFANIFDGDITEIYIKSKTQLIHIVYEDSYRIHKFNKYGLLENETVIIAGQEISVDRTCLEDDNFTVFEMLHYDNSNIVISKNFKYDEKAFRKIAMSYDKNNEFHEHLLDRIGLHHRWK